ncbi:fanconi anemia group J protein, partial [Tanacetum coccineum]
PTRLVKVGEMVQGCSYFGAQGMAEVADIVFCPYNYIINPQIRKAMEISVEGNIIILDEAHNIEDIAQDAGCIDVGEDVLFQLQTDLENLCQSKRVAESDQLGIYRPLYEMIEGIISWIRRRKKSLGKHSFQHNASCWTAEKALRELEEASISKQCFPSLQCATKAIRIAADADPDIDHLSGMASTVIEGLFSSLTYFFSGNGKHICDYQLALQCQTTKSEAGLQLALQGQTIKSEAGFAAEESPCTFSLWCLNPSLVFKNMADTCLSVILTSGTLSPMSSFQSELGVQFGTSLEAPHVINVDSQLWAGVIHSGPNHYPLNASYKTSESFDFQDAVGASLEEICKVVPGGCLVFFPSYKLMDKLRSRWSQTGQWKRLNAQKPVCVEPRGAQEDFENVLKDYYDTIRQGNKPTTTGRRRGKKVDAIGCSATMSNGNIKKGATFLAVCRGKVSEGIDFSDENARAVIIVGIPFPNVTLSPKPRGAQEDFENVLKDYYDTIRQGNKPTPTGRRRGKKVDAIGCSATMSNGNIKKGATFLAVCRGKVSEGIDFSDENARAVIIVGIPFPNVYDIKVSEKKKYNDAYKSSKGLLSGNEWYCQQAFRALNQAADERFRQERNLAYLSKWLRNSIRQYDDFGQSLEGLKSFFRDIKVESKASSTQPVDVKPIDVEESKNWFTEMKNSKVTKINSKGSNGVATPQVATKIEKWSVLTKKYDCSLVKTESKGPEERTANKSDKNTGVAYIDLETENRRSSPPSMNISHDDFELTVVAETPNYNEPFTVKKEPINEAYSTTVVKPSDVEESKSCFTEMKNSKVTKINSKGSNGVAASQVATRINKCAVLTKKYDCSLLKTESKGPEERTANKNDKTTGVAYIDLETENRCSSLPSMNISHEDFEPTVAEIPNYNEPLTVKKEPINAAYLTTVESVCEVDFSHSTIIQTNFPHQQLPHSFTSPCSTSASAFNTPKKEHLSRNKSPLYSSVNSHVHKRIKFLASETVKIEQYDSPDPKTPTEINQFSVPQSCILDVPEASSATCGDVTKKELKISCSLCRNPLGLVENNYFVSCSVTSLSMVHLATIWKGIATGSTSVPVVVSDISSVDRKFFEKTSESGIGQGIWSKEDGCVFNTIFCTFCNNQDSCLGLHVVATDSGNVQFLNKLLFYSDRLEIQHIEASVNSKEVSPSSVTSVSKSPEQNPFEKFAYVPPETN